MTPGARVQAAIDILEGLATSRLPADRFIREFFRARRYAGSKDRAAVSERVYDVFRHRASFAWRMGSETPRALVIASLLKDGADVPALFTGDGYGPPELNDEERNRIAKAPAEPAPHVKGEYPQFLESELQRAFGEDVSLEMSAMLERAPVDLRVNALKATRDDVLAALKAEGFDVSATRYSPFGIRLPAGARGLEQSKAFLSGAFEFQDEAAQVAVLLAQAKPGSRVLDLAAGAGGKSLALAAAMNNSGELTAHDIDEGRLRQLAPRAARAGVTIITTHAGPQPPKRPYDLVLLDAPCSGSGTWRRSPENKWRLTPERLDQLNALQDKLLDQAAARAAGKARIVYATCSILPRENEDRVAAFLERHPAFKVIPASEIWRESTGNRPPPGLGEFLKVTPLVDEMDGFFTAILARAA
ncbi:MAG TPA: RsmB/NOP family class I SAM-dependent RNA methyltransferase [Rhizomicrobium sp.]|nr:RsmB/NOP family class I SAM-dependent RNA methyltransferase [Rhizomicrobium sp.]